MHNFYSISQKTLVNCFHICLIIRYIPAGFKGQIRGPLSPAWWSEYRGGRRPCIRVHRATAWKVSGSKAGVMLMLWLPPPPLSRPPERCISTVVAGCKRWIHNLRPCLPTRKLQQSRMCHFLFNGQHTLRRWRQTSFGRWWQNGINCKEINVNYWPVIVLCYYKR